MTTQPHTNEQKVNYPHRIYPGFPCSGYPKNLNELYRIAEFIEELCNTTEQILLHLTIGAPAEENGFFDMKNTNDVLQMYQIIPEHIIEFARSGIRVVSVVVCPNQVDSPLFMRFTDDWKKISDFQYQHNELPITLNFFFTMMPAHDERNEYYMKIMVDRGIYQMLPDGIEQYRQTFTDRVYIEHFYNKLAITFQHIKQYGGVVSCFSFAVFNDNSDKRKYNNFWLFRELVQVCKTQGVLLCEWLHARENYFVYATCDDEQRSICYIPPDELCDMTSSNVRDSNCQFIRPINSDGYLSLQKILYR